MFLTAVNIISGDLHAVSSPNNVIPILYSINGVRSSIRTLVLWRQLAGLYHSPARSSRKIRWAAVFGAVWCSEPHNVIPECGIFKNYTPACISYWHIYILLYLSWWLYLQMNKKTTRLLPILAKQNGRNFKGCGYFKSICQCFTFCILVESVGKAPGWRRETFSLFMSRGACLWALQWTLWLFTSPAEGSWQL